MDQKSPITLGGFRAGPLLSVDGPPVALDALTDRLLRIPSLPHMRGALVVGPVDQDGIDGQIDLDTVHEADAVWTVLAAAAQLGMIAGRGVPRRFFDADPLSLNT